MGRRLQTSLCQTELRRTLRENGKDYVNICHSMCIKNFLKLPFWHEAGIWSARAPSYGKPSPPSSLKARAAENVWPCSILWARHHGCSCWRGRRLAGEVAVSFARPSGVGQARSSCSLGAPSSLAILLNSVSASGNHGHACSSRFSTSESTADMAQSYYIRAHRSSEASHNSQLYGESIILSQRRAAPPLAMPACISVYRRDGMHECCHGTMQMTCVYTICLQCIFRAC